MQLRQSFFQVVRFDPTQKPIPAPNSYRDLLTILDPSSSSQIHLWNKSQIVSSTEGDSTDGDLTAQLSADRLESLAAVSNLKSTDNTCTVS
jgi:hypothetical protein